MLADTPVAPDVAARWAQMRERMTRYNDGGSSRRVLAAIAERVPALGVSTSPRRTVTETVAGFSVPTVSCFGLDLTEIFHTALT